MSNFKHSIVLFSGEDGLPLEFNIVNTTEKELLKAIIEHGGGLCTLGDNAIHLVSPGTKVFNVNFNNKFLSSTFIFDCAEKNFLLNMSDYEVKITALETSDISDDSGNIIKPSDNIKCAPVTGININTIEIGDEEESSQNSANKIVCSNVCSDDFQPAKLGMFSSTPSLPAPENSPKKVVAMDLILEESSLKQAIEEYPSASEIGNCTKRDVTEMDIDIELSSAPNFIIEEYNSISKIDDVDKNQAETTDARPNCSNLGEGEISDRTPSDLQIEGLQINESEQHISKGKGEYLVEKIHLDVQNANILSDQLQQVEKDELHLITAPKKSPEVTVTEASSSEPLDDVNGFDCMMFKNSQNAVNKEDECLSQSYTVSSSADAQVSNKADISGEIFENNIPDKSDCGQQDGQVSERRIYIQNLEKEVEQILQRPSPKSLQDKICLVKYICCVKRLPPAEVLQSLQNF